MLHRRAVLSLIASAGTLSASSAREGEASSNGNALLGAKIKQNGKHKIHMAGMADVFAEVSNGKVVGVSATGMQVRKVKTRQKLALAQSLIGSSLDRSRDHPRQPLQHDRNHRQVGEAHGHSERFVMGHQTTIAAQPRESALDHPAATQDLKAAVLVGAFDDFQLDRQPAKSARELWPGLAAISEIFFSRGYFRSALSIRPAAQSRSWTFAGITSSERKWPSVSTRALRLMPLIFLPAS